MAIKKNAVTKVDNKEPIFANGESAVIGQFVGKCCDANVMNNNQMHLGPDVFKTLIASDEFKRAMENRHYIGFLGHPEDPDCQEFEHACIVMTDLNLEDNGEVTGTFDLINTPVGRIVKTFKDAGVKFGISIRGAGDVDAAGEVDPEGFVFRGFDLVAFPAYDDCIPEFKEIAASTDIEKKAKFKKICASIDANLSQINSCTALELIQDQLPTGCEEYCKIQDRIDEINGVDDCKDVIQQKLDAMTELYLDAAATIRTLEQELIDTQLNNQQLVVECKSLKMKQSHLKKIVANQISDATEDRDASLEEAESYRRKMIKAKTELRSTKQQLANVQKQYDEQITANTNLKEKLTSLSSKRKEDLEEVKASKDLNLKYQRKIEANSEAISQKDSELEDLKSQLDETVIECKDLEAKASNLGEENEELLSRVEAAEEMVHSYQKAYANIYANALGIYLPGLPVTASTSVEELRAMINAGTSTANIPAAPSVSSLDENESDEDDEDFDTTGYSADLVTL